MKITVLEKNIIPATDRQRQMIMCLPMSIYVCACVSVRQNIMNH